MHDPWLDRLSEYIDGDMGAADAHALERHLAGCAACSATLAGLRDVVAAARSLEDRPPARDLWAGIAAAIEAGQATTAASMHGSAYGAAIPLRPAAPAPRRFSFSAPQLAAAALVIMTVSAGAAWLIGGADTRGAVYEQGAIFHAAGSPPTEVHRVDAAEQPALPSAAVIDEALAAARSTLDPATVEVLERSIESINAAIAVAHAALEADPGNPYLQRQLDSTLQRRQDVLRRASRVQRAGT